MTIERPRKKEYLIENEKLTGIAPTEKAKVLFGIYQHNQAIDLCNKYYKQEMVRVLEGLKITAYPITAEGKGLKMMTNQRITKAIEEAQDE